MLERHLAAMRNRQSEENVRYVNTETLNESFKKKRKKKKKESKIKKKKNKKK